MAYWFTDLGTLKAGSFVEVKMNIAANVRILAESAFEEYKKKAPHQFIGGYVKFSPYTVNLPETGHWYIVVDRGGKPGTVSASVSVYQNVRKREKQIMLPEEEPV
jgi:hypothetical protein